MPAGQVHRPRARRLREQILPGVDADVRAAHEVHSVRRLQVVAGTLARAAHLRDVRPGAGHYVKVDVGVHLQHAVVRARGHITRSKTPTGKYGTDGIGAHTLQDRVAEDARVSGDNLVGVGGTHFTFASDRGPRCAYR